MIERKMKKWFINISLALAAIPAAADTPDGKAIFTQICRACHATGVAGAPVIGDKAAWAGRIANGPDNLLQSALRGKGGMPPKGGNPGLSDEQVRAAMEYMISQSR